MMIMFAAAAVLALTAMPAVAGKPTPAIGNSASADNSEMKAIYADDQRVRQPGYKGAWNDEPRQAKVRDLIAKTALKTGTDFGEAAFIFQHGETTDDILLAHTLAMIAVAKGKKEALWIAGATLDRYLQRIGQKQIYGTQFQLMDSHGKFSINGHWTQEPYDRNLISDALRGDLGLPSRAEQLHQMESYLSATDGLKSFKDQLKAQVGK